MPRPTPTSRETRASMAPAPATGLPDAEGGVRFSVLNAAFLAAGLVAVIAGFVLLSGGSTVAAPLLLVLGYVVLIPIGVIR